LGEGATGLYTVVLNGPVGLLGRRASPWAASCRLISCRAGPALWADNEAQPSLTSCSCRPGPEKIVLGSCSCRAKKSCYGLAHGPRTKWSSIASAGPVLLVRGARSAAGAHGGARPAMAETSVILVLVDPTPSIYIGIPAERSSCATRGHRSHVPATLGTGNVEHHFVKSWYEGGIHISYVSIRDGTRSKCVGNDVPGTLFRNEEHIPNYLGRYHCRGFDSFFCFVFFC
jgi:hypothetical protein